MVEATGVCLVSDDGNEEHGLVSTYSQIFVFQYQSIVFVSSHIPIL